MRLKKIGTVNNVADLNTKNLSAGRRKYLFGLCGLSENQKKTSTHVTTTKQNFLEHSVARRIAFLLAALPVSEATSMYEIAEEVVEWKWIIFSLLISAVTVISLLSMMTGGSSESSSSESPESRRRRYLNASLTEVSDPDEWMGLHHFEESEVDEEDPNESAGGEPEQEPSDGLTPEVMEQYRHWEHRIFLIFNIVVQEKFNQWGRRIEPQFERELASWTTNETFRKTFFQLRLLAMLLDEKKFEQVENVCMCLEGTMGHEIVQRELEKLEEGHVDDKSLTEAIRWLYMRYRDKCIGSAYDRVKWAAEVYGSDEESLVVSRERALEAISERMEMAFIRRDEREYGELEQLHRRVGLM